MNKRNTIKLVVDSRAGRERFTILKTKGVEPLKREGKASGRLKFPIRQIRVATSSSIYII